VLQYLRNTPHEPYTRSAEDLSYISDFQQILDEFDFFCTPVRFTPSVTNPKLDYTKQPALVAEKDCIPLMAKWYGNSVIVSGDNGIFLWNPATNLTTDLLSERVCALCILDNRIIVGGSGGQIWSINPHAVMYWGESTLTRESVKSFATAHTEGVMAFKLYPRDKIISVSEDGTIKMWNLETGTCISSITGHSKWVLDVDVYENIIATCSADRTIKIWQYHDASNSWICLRTLTGHTDTVWTVQINKEGTLIVSAAEDKTIRFWDLKNGSCVRTLHCRDSVVCFIIEGNLLFEGLGNGMIEVWDLETEKCLVGIPAHKRNWVSSLSLDGNRLVSSSYKHRLVCVWAFNYLLPKGVGKC